eukprot:GFYU01000057.1.p1 GENE.GFYU01000057.1~~GFYU01000057.1.p1  ORF type:complete len:233 (-),score=81.93 GFYU01000057.1:122-820(-)
MKCVSDVASGLMFLINFVDGLIGLFIACSAVYLTTKGFIPHWAESVLFIIAGMLLLIVMFSMCGSAGRYGCCLTLSFWFTIPLILALIAIATTLLVESDKLQDYLKDHKEDLDLTDDEYNNAQDLLEKLHQVFAYVLYIAAAAEILRAMCTRRVLFQQGEDVYRWRREDELELLMEDTRRMENEDRVKTKYTNLREKYRSKWGDNSGAAPARRFSDQHDEEESSFFGWFKKK